MKFSLKIEVDEKATPPFSTPSSDVQLKRAPIIHSFHSQSQSPKFELPTDYSWESQYPILGFELRRLRVPQKPYSLPPTINPNLFPAQP